MKHICFLICMCICTLSRRCGVSEAFVFGPALTTEIPEDNVCFAMECSGKDCLYGAIVKAGDNVTTCTNGPFTKCFVELYNDSSNEYHMAAGCADVFYCATMYNIKCCYESYCNHDSPCGSLTCSEGTSSTSNLLSFLSFCVHLVVYEL